MFDVPGSPKGHWVIAREEATCRLRMMTEQPARMLGVAGETKTVCYPVTWSAAAQPPSGAGLDWNNCQALYPFTVLCRVWCRPETCLCSLIVALLHRPP